MPEYFVWHFCSITLIVAKIEAHGKQALCEMNILIILLGKMKCHHCFDLVHDLSPNFCHWQRSGAVILLHSRVGNKHNTDLPNREIYLAPHVKPHLPHVCTAESVYNHWPLYFNNHLMIVMIIHETVQTANHVAEGQCVIMQVQLHS